MTSAGQNHVIRLNTEQARGYFQSSGISDDQLPKGPMKDYWGLGEGWEGGRGSKMKGETGLLRIPGINNVPKDRDERKKRENDAFSEIYRNAGKA